MNEYDFNVKLSSLQALSTWSKISGGKSAAVYSIKIIQRMVDFISRPQGRTELRFSIKNGWRKLCTLIFRKYEINPYLCHRPYYLSMMACLPKAFAYNILLREHNSINKELGRYVKRLTDKIIRQQRYYDITEITGISE